MAHQGKIVRELRDTRGWTVQDLCDRLAVEGENMCRSNCAAMENREWLSAKQVALLCHIFGVPVKLFFPDEIATPPKETKKEAIERAWSFMQNDPTSTFTLNEAWPLSAKYTIVRMYESLTGTKLLPEHFDNLDDEDERGSKMKK